MGSIWGPVWGVEWAETVIWRCLGGWPDWPDSARLARFGLFGGIKHGRARGDPPHSPLLASNTVSHHLHDGLLPRGCGTQYGTLPVCYPLLYI